jgi:hypothetical protein
MTMPRSLSSPATRARLVDQLKWSGEKGANHKDRYLRLKVAQIVIAATIPVVAA